MNTRVPQEAGMVGAANFLSKIIMPSLKGIGILIVVMLRFIVSLLFGVIRRM